MIGNEFNMTQIAKLAGVSQATVSRVLNQTDGVAEEKKQAVLAVVRQYQFTPRAKRQAATKPALRVGLMITGPVHHLASELLLRTQQSLVEHLPTEAGLLFLPPFETPERMRRVVQSQGVAGILVAGHHETPELTGFLEKVPHVWLNSRETGDHPTALSGNELAGGLAAQTFLNAGCERLLVIDYPSHNPGLRSRVDGFRFETLRSGQEAVISTITGSPFEDASAEENTRRLSAAISAHDLHHAGLFCPDDRLTVILYPLLRSLGLTPGTDLLLISCNNQKEALAGLLPRPATIDLSPELTAQMALAQLIKLMDGTPEPERLNVVIRPELIPSDTASFRAGSSGQLHD